MAQTVLRRLESHPTAERVAARTAREWPVEQSAGSIGFMSAYVVVDPLSRLLSKARSRITPLEPNLAFRALEDGAILVDIRPEFQRRADGEIPGAIVIERNHLEWRLHPSSTGRIPEAAAEDTCWIIVCDEGYASSLAAATLRMIGVSRATDVAGGFQAWRDAGLPVERPDQPTPPRLAPVTDPRDEAGLLEPQCSA